ncbi:MAG: dienelactone hydrolase family protein [Pirellulaceae bacterium]|nr:dienelactone hydrolase family protein [Pirellulaceae bacterium]
MGTGTQRIRAWAMGLLCLAAAEAGGAESWPPEYPGTAVLTWKDDIASHLVAGVDRFLLRELERSEQVRAESWQRDLSSVTAYEASVEPQRQRLAHILGVRDRRIQFAGLTLDATTAAPAVVAETERYRVFAVGWPVVGPVRGAGLLLVPRDAKPLADVIAVPDADQTPEMVCGLSPGVADESQFARTLAESGCRVLVPALIDRRLEPRNGRATLTTREYLYRSAFELGRHLIGYEVQKILSGVDWFAREQQADDPQVAVIGWGEGAMLSLYSAALDPRIDVACVSGYFEPREGIWQQPIDRNVFGLLERFGDAELAAMIAPRTLVVEAACGPQVTLPPGTGGAPAQLATPALDVVRREVQRAEQLVQGLTPAPWLHLVVSGAGDGPFLTPTTIAKILGQIHPAFELGTRGSAPTWLRDPGSIADRARQQTQEIDDCNQWLLRESSYVRQEFMSKVDTSSLAAYEASIAPYRERFRCETIGAFDQPLLPPQPRTRKTYEQAAWVGYDVVLDVFPDVLAYGILLVPRNIAAGERRPVVVCQHGLEGRPQDVVAGDNDAYHDFAAKLAERGFVTFAPQNLYIFGDRFRTLQRKANPLGKTLFSIIVPQHQQIVNWLSTLPCVDPARIAFYGLSYGGKSAMRIPPLVPNYCLSICSADFNEWVWKNASTRSTYSYVWTGEYEIFEFDLGSTFNYAEMAALIAPRPFMVERGHFDGVAPDEMVGHEFAKVRHLYAAKLGIGDRCEIEWFVGPHTIHGQGTFEFLHKHLQWPRP